jgi:2,3,4,5-tetrahydropyridine-2-carboxylate N-succinyltransferase
MESAYMTVDKLGRGVVAYGFSTLARDGSVLDAWYPSITMEVAVPSSQTSYLSSEDAILHLGSRAAAIVRRDDRRDVEVVAISTHISDLAAPPLNRHDVFLRLHLLSSRRVKPGAVNLDGILATYITVAWTSIGPCLPERVDEARWVGRATGDIITVNGLWPTQPMTDYVTPSFVRILNPANVMLGAHLAPGTMVTSAGFVNLNAGTLGPSMIEGTISMGVVVGEGCHLGDGATLIGTTSGGGKRKVSIGRNCLIGAHAGVGIVLGDDCVVEAGCFITAGSIVTLSDGRTVKADELSGTPSLLFRRHSAIVRG